MASGCCRCMSTMWGLLDEIATAVTPAFRSRHRRDASGKTRSGSGPEEKSAGSVENDPKLKLHWPSRILGGRHLLLQYAQPQPCVRTSRNVTSRLLLSSHNTSRTQRKL